MSVRLILVAMALGITPVSILAADDEHPLKKSKAGDFATYTRTINGYGGVTNIAKRITYVVVLNCDKENAIILKATGEGIPETLYKVDLSKPFDPNSLPGLARGGYEDLKGVKQEKIENAKDTIKVGDHDYECTKVTHKFKGKAADALDCEVEMNVWVSKDLPLGLVKLSWICSDMTSKMKYELTLELNESGNKK